MPSPLVVGKRVRLAIGLLPLPLLLTAPLSSTQREASDTGETQWSEPQSEVGDALLLLLLLLPLLLPFSGARGGWSEAIPHTRDSANVRGGREGERATDMARGNGAVTTMMKEGCRATESMEPDFSLCSNDVVQAGGRRRDEMWEH